MSQNNPTTYMFVFRYPTDVPDPTPEEMQKIFEGWRVWIQSMRDQGVYAGGDPLEDEPAKVLRGGKVTDGPFAEAKEVVAGYIMVRTPDFASAVALAQQCPSLQLPKRTVEVRQLKPMTL